MADEVSNDPVEPGISDEAFQELADSPKNLRGDEGSVTERNAKDLIDMDRYLKGGAAGNNGPPFGMRVASIKFPSTV